MTSSPSMSFPSDDYDALQYSSLYTMEQERAIFWAPKLPAFLSIFSSAFMAYVVINDKSRRTKVYGRLWLGVFLSNMLVNICTILSTIPAPVGTYYGAMGTETTCSWVGFIYHIVFVVNNVYNGALGLYYLMVMKGTWTEDTVRKKIEPVIHSVAILYALVGAIIGKTMNFYHPNELILQCWVGAAPLGCTHDGAGDALCTSGYQYRNAFIVLSGLIELNTCTTCKIFSTIAILYAVIKNERMMSTRWSNNTRKKGQSLARETFWQSFFFVGVACFVPLFPMLVVRCIDMKRLYWPDNQVTETFYRFSLYAQTMFGTQGLCNLVIFFRPRFVQRRKRFPSESCWESLKIVLSFKKPTSSLEEKGKQWKKRQPTSKTLSCSEVKDDSITRSEGGNNQDFMYHHNCLKEENETERDLTNFDDSHNCFGECELLSNGNRGFTVEIDEQEIDKQDMNEQQEEEEVDA